MPPQMKKVSDAGLLVTHCKSDNIYPLLPLLSQEFPNWTIDKIKNYVKLVISKNNDVAGMLVAQNEAAYYVGLLVYTCQSSTSELLGNTKKDQFIKGIVVENLIASSPILQKQVFMALVEATVNIAKHLSCDYVELPRVDRESFQFVRKKYGPRIDGAKGFRSYIDLSSPLKDCSPLG